MPEEQHAHSPYSRAALHCRGLADRRGRTRCRRGHDAGRVAVGRTLMAAAQFARRPRPTVYIVSGEDAADRAARSLAAYVGWRTCAAFPSARTILGASRHLTTLWWRSAAKPWGAWCAGTRYWLPRPARCCAVCRRSRVAIGSPPPLRWARRFLLMRCRSAWWAWATPMPAQPMRPACSACTATPSRCFPRRKRRPCASSSLATRSTASAAW